MTREEAIKILKIKRDCSDYEGHSCRKDQRGRWIELPCEIGDTVYFTNDEDQEIYEATVTGFEINAHGLYINSDYEIGTKAVDDYLFYTRKKAEEAVYGADMRESE